MDIANWTAVPHNNEVSLSIRLLDLNAQQIVDGRRRQSMVFGGAGCGKTFTIDRALHAFRGKGLEPIYANPTGYRDILAAYEEAFETCGGKPSRVRPIFFDEADTIFASEKCLNILKVAFAPDRRQRVYNNMIVDAPVFISTNRKIDAFSAGKRPHIEAVFDRQPPIVVPDDPYASWEYACYLALMTDMNRTTRMGRPISLAVQVRALEWFTDNARHLTVIGPRALHQAAETMSMAMPDWAEERELRTLLSKKSRTMNRQVEQHDWLRLILDLSQMVKAGKLAA